MNHPADLPWDYTALADTYDARPGYCESLLREILSEMNLCRGERVLDVGAGTGRLTRLLCDHGFDVTALEPNDRMRRHAFAKPALQRARWVAARGEALPIAAGSMRLVAYGSSFNVLALPSALDECARVLRPGGAWLAVWNHRDLDDELQRAVESIIHRHLPGYEYGSRRESPVAALSAHGAFGQVAAVERRFVAAISVAQWNDAWRSHATLRRQAGGKLGAILADIGSLVESATTLRVPYKTRAWTARRVPR